MSIIEAFLNIFFNSEKEMMIRRSQGTGMIDFSVIPKDRFYGDEPTTTEWKSIRNKVVGK
jgi:hypothetical protein